MTSVEKAKVTRKQKINYGHMRILINPSFKNLRNNPQAVNVIFTLTLRTVVTITCDALKILLITAYCLSPGARFFFLLILIFRNLPMMLNGQSQARRFIIAEYPLGVVP